MGLRASKTLKEARLELRVLPDATSMLACPIYLAIFVLSKGRVSSSVVPVVWFRNIEARRDHDQKSSLRVCYASPPPPPELSHLYVFTIAAKRVTGRRLSIAEARTSQRLASAKGQSEAFAMNTKAASERHQRQLMELVKLPGNEICADCTGRNPRWASWSLGIFICVQCAGVHRKMGT